MPRTSVARHGCFNKGTIRRLAPWDLAARFQNLVFCFAAFAARTMARILERALADRFFFRFGCRVAGWNFFRVSEPRHAGPRFASLSSGFLATGSLKFWVSSYGVAYVLVPPSPIFDCRDPFDISRTWPSSVGRSDCPGHAVTTKSG